MKTIILIACNLLFALQFFASAQVTTCIILENGDKINCTNINGKQGVWKTFRRTRIISIEHYIDNKKFGSSIYYRRRNKITVSNYYNDLKVDSNYYIVNGKIRWLDIYDSTGKIIEGFTNYVNGNTRFHRIYYYGNESSFYYLNSYFRNGRKSVEVRITGPGKSEIIVYRRNGKIKK